MSLGLVAYGDSDESDNDEGPTTGGPPQRPQQAPRTAPAPASVSRPDFKRPPPPLFPGAVAQSGPARKSTQSTYSQLVERDESGRIRVTAPRLENHDSDEEDEERQMKKPKLVQNPGTTSTGLMAVLPKPEGPKKKGEVAKDSTSAFDQMFAKKKKETNTTETVKFQGASQIRYEAEMKKAELLRKFMKKAPVEEPEDDDDDDDDDEVAGSQQAVYYPPAEPDYLGLNHRAVGNVRFAAEGAGAGAGPSAAGEEDVGWEVDESAYETDDYALGATETPAMQHPPIFGPQPGAVWTANYKYQDVQNLLENPRHMAHQAPAGFATNQQVEKLIARYEGPEFQEYLNMGNKIEILDVRADDHLGPNPRANVMKQLTEQEANPPSRPMVIKGKVNKQAKQKGQITFLAAQAVARESELQNEWARNRQARQQASHRYGF